MSSAYVRATYMKDSCLCHRCGIDDYSHLSPEIIGIFTRFCLIVEVENTKET